MPVHLKEKLWKKKNEIIEKLKRVTWNKQAGIEEISEVLIGTNIAWAILDLFIFPICSVDLMFIYNFTLDFIGSCFGFN